MNTEQGGFHSVKSPLTNVLLVKQHSGHIIAADSVHFRKTIDSLTAEDIATAGDLKAAQTKALSCCSGMPYARASRYSMRHCGAGHNASEYLEVTVYAYLGIKRKPPSKGQYETNGGCVPGRRGIGRT